jgi:hypothetical protein
MAISTTAMELSLEILGLMINLLHIWTDLGKGGKYGTIKVLRINQGMH